MVKINLLKDEPYILAYLGVKISESPLDISLDELYEECKRDEKRSKEEVNKIIKKHNHNILLDFTPYAITLDGLSRFAALYLWRNVSALNLIYGAGIEASFRVIKPSNYRPEVSELGSQALDLYEELLEKGIKKQDARYVIPEGALTRMIFTAPPRYLLKLSHSLEESGLRELKEIGAGIKKFVEDMGYEVDIKENSPTSWEIWGKGLENGNSKIKVEYDGRPSTLIVNSCVKGSLSLFAQLVRERPSVTKLEPAEAIARRGRFVVPNSFSNEMKEQYLELARTAKEEQNKLIEEGDPNFVYYLLLGQEAKGQLTGAGPGVIESIRKRACGAAQWEIRSEIGVKTAKEFIKEYPELGAVIGPGCWRKGHCTEPRTFKDREAKCPVFEKYKGKKPESIEELLNLLYEPPTIISV